MTCDRRDDVAAYLLGGLTTDEALEIEHHVLECDECAQTRRELSIVRSLLDTMPDEPVQAEPVDLRDTVVASMVRTHQPGRRRDLGLVLLGAAAALIIGVVSFVAIRSSHDDAPAARDMELIDPTDMPGAWAQVNLHPRAEGTIVDLEAGGLPTDGSTYVLRVTASGEVLTEQPFTVSPDGWAQVLTATTRPLGPSDVIEVARVQAGSDEPVLRCECSA